MKKCDHFRDLILTDYIDGELVKGPHRDLENHLVECGDCRAFLKEVENNLAWPWKQTVTQQPVPDELWGTIKQRIEHEDQARGPFADLMDNLKDLFLFPRLVPVFASLIVMFLAGSVTLNTVLVKQAREKDQGEYLVSLLSPTGSSAPSDYNDGAGPIEHYFL